MESNVKDKVIFASPKTEEEKSIIRRRSLRAETRDRVSRRAR
jgi:hypothetical protein